MSGQLTFDFNVAVEWDPILIPHWEKPAGASKAEAAVLWKAYAASWRCRDCGTKSKLNQGGSSGWVCDDCAEIDGCRIRPHNPVLERRPGQWGIRVDQAAHCDDCGWWVSAVGWVDGVWVEIPADEITADVEAHATPRHTSYWGKSHEISSHVGLAAAREQRRAKYRREVAS